MKNEFLKNLTCDICGKSLTDTNHIGVVSADEILCLNCFRHGEEYNYGEIVELNAKVYSLKSKLESARKEKTSEFRRGFNWGANSNKGLKDEYHGKVLDLLEDYYVLALKSESAASIELIKDLKKEIMELL